MQHHCHGPEMFEQCCSIMRKLQRSYTCCARCKLVIHRLTPTISGYCGSVSLLQPGWNIYASSECRKCLLWRILPGLTTKVDVTEHFARTPPGIIAAGSQGNPPAVTSFPGSGSRSATKNSGLLRVDSWDDRHLNAYVSGADDDEDESESLMSVAWSPSAINRNRWLFLRPLVSTQHWLLFRRYT